MSRHILATMAGGAADCAFWIRHLAMQVRVRCSGSVFVLVTPFPGAIMSLGEFLAYSLFSLSIVLQARLYEVENEGQQLTVKRASKLLANNIARYVGRKCGCGDGKKVLFSLVDDKDSLPFDAVCLF